MAEKKKTEAKKSEAGKAKAGEAKPVGPKGPTLQSKVLRGPANPKGLQGTHGAAIAAANAEPKAQAKGAGEKSGTKAATEKKEDKKADSKPEVKAETKAKKPKAAKKSRKVIAKKSKEVLAMRRKVLAKAGHPVFRGRFGKRATRKKANPKWDKWRFPRGLDVNHELSEGFNPRGGYGTPVEIRHVHPSGHREVIVRTIAELERVPKNHAVRVVGAMGSRKKMVLVDKAIEKGIRVLNP